MSRLMWIEILPFSVVRSWLGLFGRLTSGWPIPALASSISCRARSFNRFCLSSVSYDNCTKGFNYRVKSSRTVSTSNSIYFDLPVTFYLFFSIYYAVFIKIIYVTNSNKLLPFFFIPFIWDLLKKFIRQINHRFISSNKFFVKDSKWKV